MDKQEKPKVRLVCFLDWQLRQAFKVCAALEGRKVSSKLEELVLNYVKENYAKLKGS